MKRVYAAMNPVQAPVVVKKIFQIVSDLKKKGVTADELAMTKEQIKTEIILGNESAKSIMSANGKSMLNRGRIVPIEELIDGIDKVTQKDILDYANNYFDIKNASISIVGRLEEIDLNSLA